MNPSLFFRTIRNYPFVRASDALRNRRFAKADKRFLILHHAGNNPFFYDILLHWLELYAPKSRSFFELRLLPCHVSDWSRYALFVPWLQDPVQHWSPRAYNAAMRMTRRCEERSIPVVNRVDHLIHATKSRGSETIRQAGFRTPRIQPAQSHSLNYPILLRNDWGHGGPILKVESIAEFSKVNLKQFDHPVALEYIDVRSPDGFFRKYRYFVAGEFGSSVSMHVGRDWMVRGTGSLLTRELVDEEIRFLAEQNPHQKMFRAAAKAMGLDFVAFDYSLDSSGNPIVWEANPYPYIHFPSVRGRIRWKQTSRLLAQMTRLYFEKAGFEVPEEIKALQRDPSSE